MIQFLSFLVIFISISSIIYLVWLHKFSHFGKTIRKIPGPPGIPIFGNIFNYYPPTPENIFKKISTEFKKYGVIYKEWFVHKAVVYIIHPDDLELVLSGKKHLDKSVVYDFLHLWLKTGLLTSKAQKWQQRRKILTPAFHFAILQEFVPIFNKKAEELVDTLEDLTHINSSIDVLNPISQFTLFSIAETSMGIKLDASSDDCEKYKKSIHIFGKTLALRSLKPWLYNDLCFSLFPTGWRANKAIKILHNFSRKVIAERKKQFCLVRKKPSKKFSMLDLLLQNNGVDIDDEGIAEEVDTFIFEGHDTTAAGISYTLLCLANHPIIQQEVYEEMKSFLGNEVRPPSYSDLKNLALMERCIKESLRLFPSVPLFARKASEDFKTSSGFVIPKGTMLNMFIYEMHRLPEFFSKPEKFDPDRLLPGNCQKRHPFCYLPFSAGPRNCIGQRYAMLELKAALCAILRKFVLKPVDRLEDLVFCSGLILRAKNGINVQFKMREKVQIE